MSKHCQKRYGSMLCGSKAAMASDGVVLDLMLPAFSGCLGQCASAHNRHAMECPREIRALWRALLLPFEKEPMVLRELVRFGPSIRPHGELLFFLMQKKPAFMPDSEAFNSFIGDDLLIPELKGGSEASEDDQADNVSSEALYVIGLHGSGDRISCFVQDWEVAKVA